MMNYKLAENISWRDIQGQVLILDPRINQKAHELNAIGSYIWMGLEQGESTSKLIDKLYDHYKDQCSYQEMTKEAQDFIDELLQLELIHHA